LIAAESLVFKQDSKYYEHFYADLKPFVHYVPINANISDLIEKLKWAAENEDEAKKIVYNANQYAREFLQPHHLYCYHVKLFHVIKNKFFF
jgi:hypothetical protein